MLDLGTSFLASVSRDPNALAIVDGGVRLTYAQWYRRISALVAGFDRLGLQPGDHLVTALQNNYLDWRASKVIRRADILYAHADQSVYSMRTAHVRVMDTDATTGALVPSDKIMV